jgi:hypothetical protein
MTRYDVQGSSRSPLVGPASGTILWSFHTGAFCEGRPAIAADGTVYFVSWNVFYAVNPDGTEKWHKDDAYYGYNNSSPLVGPDGTVYGVFRKDGTFRLLALRPADGSVVWEVIFGSNGFNCPPIWRSDSTLFAYVGLWLYALNSASGLEKHDAKRLGGSSEIALSLDGTRIYADRVKAYDAETFDELWSGPEGKYPARPVVGSDGTVYGMGNSDTFLVALNPVDGQEKWSLDLESKGGSPALGSDTLYVFTRSAQVHAVSLAGVKRWTFDTGSEESTDGQLTRGPVVDQEGTVYFGTWGKGLFALRPNMEIKWHLLDPTKAFISFPVVGPNRRIYAGSDKGLLAIGAEEPPVTSVTAHIATAAEIFWDSQVGKSYVVEYSDDVPTRVWKPLGFPVAGTGQEMSAFDSTRRSAKRFYRVIEQ